MSASASGTASWLDGALARAGVGRALSAGSLTGETDTATLDQAAQRAEDLGIGGLFGDFRSTLSWVGYLVIGAELVLALGVVAFIVWIVRKSALEIFG